MNFAISARDNLAEWVEDKAPRDADPDVVGKTHQNNNGKGGNEFRVIVPPKNPCKATVEMNYP